MLTDADRCLAFWLHHGADLSRGTAGHPDWIALESSGASLEILQLLTPSVRPSFPPRAFRAGVELDMYVDMPGGIDMVCTVSAS